MTSKRSAEPETVWMHRNGWVPNNEAYPILVYRNVINGDGLTSNIETTFATNGWPPDWRNGIFDYHHYHSTAHEVLGFATGWAQLVLGGPGGHDVEVRAGDVILLPVGTGHCLVDASNDLLVVGAYPEGQHWDICREPPTAAMIERMRALPFPDSDPVNGDEIPLPRHWKR